MYFLRKNLFAVLFLITVFAYAGYNLYLNGEELYKLCKARVEERHFDPEELESTINSDMAFRMSFIEGYGLVQAVLDKREFNNFTSIKDEDGFLHYSSFYRLRGDDYRENALRLRRMQDYVEPYGTQVMLVIAPSKYNKDIVRLRSGLSPNDPDNVVDELLFYANQFGIETLDLRKSLPNRELGRKETFFKTDHHWTVPAAFYATGEIVRFMNKEYGLDLDPKGYYTDHTKSYTSVTYKGGMLGSMGRKTGAVFSGVDDFTAYWPNFEGDFDRVSMTNDGKYIHEKGTFNEAFINPEALDDTRDLYGGSQYALYLNELRIFESIVNKEKEDGVSILMLRDSYFSPVISFMMPMCKQIDAIWTLEESDAIDIESYVKENRFDYIIAEYYPYNIEDRAFNFFKGEIE